MLKKIITTIITAFIAVASITGCCLIKDGEEISWSKVDNTAAALKVAAQTTTYAVCYKNKDLAPIFKAVGEGLIVISGKTETDDFKPDQIEAYINELLKGYGTLGGQVNSTLEVIIERYAALVETNKDKFTDEAKMCAIWLKAIGEGFVNGSNISSVENKVAAKAKTPEQERDEAIVKLKAMDLSMVAE